MFSMFRSLRWRLQVWHAFILVVVVLVFGGLLRWEMVRAHWDRIDEELLGAARILEGSMRAVPPTVLEALAKDVVAGSGPRRPSPPANRRRRPNNEPGEARAPVSQSVILDSFPTRDWKFPARDSQPSEEQTEEEWAASIDLPTQLLEQLGRGKGTAYFVVWRNDGSTLKESKLPAQAPTISPQIQDSLAQDRFARVLRGPFREVFIAGPKETILCVGRPTLYEQDKVTTWTGFIMVCGASVIGAGLIGGWWMSKRAIEPIRLMSQTATTINASHLSERIDLAGFDTELAGLGATLNTMLDRLSQSFEQQRQFTADASHELRTPVSVILTTSELALSKPRTAEEYRDQLIKCQRAANRMRQLTDSLLTLARLDSNTKIEMQNVKLSELVQETIAFVQPDASLKSIRFEVSLESCSIRGNESLLRQAIQNLITNSIKYSRSGGNVFVRLVASDGKAILEVEDEGVGIPESAIPILFNRFFRVDESRTRSEGGTGLGLSIAQGIVNCHNGTIAVTSEIGKGSTFRIELPIQNVD
jgi:two-component system OmpR family sensor kinase